VMMPMVPRDLKVERDRKDPVVMTTTMMITTPRALMNTTGNNLSVSRPYEMTLWNHVVAAILSGGERITHLYQRLL
jgi:hypothetical protein